MATETNRQATPSWVRYSGLVIILAALLELVTSFFITVVFPEAFVPGTRDAAIVADIVVTYLILGFVGVAALYVYYGDEFGIVGNLGLLSIAVGVVVGLGSLLLTGFVGGSLLNFFLVFGGAALLSVALFRTPEIPRVAAILMGLTPIAAFITIVGFSLSAESGIGTAGYLILSIVWAGAWVIIGYHLWQQRWEPQRQS